MKEKIIKQYNKECISFEELKRFLRITGEHEDALIETFLRGAITYAECFIGTCIVKKEVSLKGKHTGKIKLRKPILEILNLKGSKGNKSLSYTLENDYLILDSKDSKNNDTIEIIYTCGNEEEDIPADLKTAIMLQVSTLYDAQTELIKLPSIILEIYGRYKNFHF